MRCLSQNFFLQRNVVIMSLLFLTGISTYTRGKATSHNENLERMNAEQQNSSYNIAIKDNTSITLLWRLDVCS